MYIYIKNKQTNKQTKTKQKKNKKNMDNLISECPTLASSEYLNRLNRVAQYLHCEICKHYGAQHAEDWYEHQLEAVTDREIKANKPDILYIDQFENPCIQKCLSSRI